MLPGVCCQGKTIEGAHIHVNFRPEVDIVRLEENGKVMEHLVRISTLESSIGGGAGMEACLA